MLRSLSLVLNFVMKSPAAENALTDLINVVGTVFKSSIRKTNIVLLFFSSYLNKF